MEKTGGFEVRLDKFLQVSRLVKRRAVANEMCHRGRVYQNGRLSKPGAKVNEGDILEIDFGGRVTRVRVLTLDTRNSTGRMYEEVTSG